MASVTITEYGKVNNIQGTPQPGGSLLPSTQYWVIVYATDAGCQVMGPVSEEYTLTTTATDLSVDLSWDVSTGSPYGYVVLITNLTVPTRWYNKKIRGLGSSVYWSTTTNALSVVGGEATYYNFHPFDMVQDFVVGMDKNLGTVTIMVDCDGSQLGPAEIDALIADPSISYADHSNWFVRGNIKFSETSPADFFATGYNITLLGFFYWDSPVVGSTIQFGDLNSSNACVITFVTHGFQRPQLTYGVCYHYGTRYNGSGTYTGNTGNVVGPYSIMVKENGATLVNINWYDDLDLRGAFAMTDSVVFGTIAVTTHADMVDFLRNSAYFWDSRTYNPSIYDCSSLASDSSTSFRKTANVGHAQRLYDFSVINKSDNIPWVYWYGASATASEEDRKFSGFEMYHSLNLMITDQTGAEVVGASVTIESSKSVVNYSGVTDVKGEIPMQYLKRVDIYRNTNTDKTHVYDTSGDYTSYDWHTPHTVTIAADGYQDYIWVGEINEKTVMGVSLTENVKPIIVNNDYSVTVCYP